MSDIKTYKLENYVPGESTFEVGLGDIFVVPNNETLKSIDYVSISNNGIIQCKKEGSGTNTKFIFTPTSNIKEPNHKYDVTVKFTLTTEINSDENTTSVKTRNCFIKLILTPEINDNTSRLNIINYMGKLSPDEYMKEHILKDDLDSLVTKKALITNLKEFGKQVQNKVSNVQVFAIRYDLEGGNWGNGNEGRTSFVNSISYVAPAPVKMGYTFNGWKLFKINDNKETATALNNGNITTDSMIPVGTNFDALCVADWTRIAYELKLYDASNVVYFNPKDVDYSKNPKLKDIKIIESDGDGNSKPISLITPEKAGYTFKYWTTTNKYGQIITCKNDQNINKVYDQIFEASNDTGTRTIELTPYFEAKVYTLNYNLDSTNATLDDSLTDSSKNNEYVYGTTFTLPIPRRNGYKFNGWTIGSLVNQFVINPTDLEDIATSTVEVKASWTAATFHLDFDLQNGSIANNSNYTLKANTAIVLSNPTRPGYTFDGWEYNSADGTVTLNNTTEEYTFTTSDTVDHDITLKAIWKESEETEYTLQIWEETLDSTDKFTSAENDTCVYRLIKSISKTGKTGTNTGFTSSNLAANSGYSISTGFELSKIENVSIKADGTSICKVYIHRKACTITIIDKYDTTSSSSFTSRTYTSLYRTDVNSIGAANTSNKISGKFGQTLIAYPIFNETYQELNYTCNTSGKSLVFTTSNQTVTFTYTKKNVRVTFDLNNVGTWTINNNEFKSDIYSIDIPYGAKLDTSHIPNVTNHNAVSSSKWLIESTSANDEISDFTEYKFTKDTKIRRIPTFYNNKVFISTENYDETNFSITNVINSAYYNTTNNTNSLSTSIRPIELLTPAFDAYNFIGYKYKFGANSSFSDKYITSINKDIWTVTSANSDLYIKACFERKEPTLDLSDSSVKYTSGTLTVENVTLSNGATKFYLSSTVPNADVSTNLGNKSILVNGIYKASISGSFATDKNHNTIVLIPSKETSTVKITGKPFIGTISGIDGTSGTATVSWIQSYQVYDNQDDASISGITATDTGTHTDITKKTSIIASTNAEKVLINKGGALSIATVSNNGISIPIDNYSLGNAEGTDLRNKVSNEIIQLTPIKHNKTGKSAILDIKKESTLIKKTEPNIIAFKDSSDYYNISDYTKVSDTLGLKSNGSYSTSLYVTSKEIYIPNLASTAPNTSKNKKLNSITYTVNDSANYADGTDISEDAAENCISLYADSTGTNVLNNLFYAQTFNSSANVDGSRVCTNKLVSLSNVTINLASINNSYTVQVGTIKISCKNLTYYSATIDGETTTSAYYTVDNSLKVIALSNKSISTPSISASDIIRCAEDKYFKITLGGNFYTVSALGRLTQCTEVYVKCSDLTIADTTLGETTSQATTNICATPTVSKDTTAINRTNSASFIKKDGGTGSLPIDIPITVYKSITYNLLSTVGNKLKTYLNSNNKLPAVEYFTENNIMIRSGDITSNNTNNSYIQWSSITLDANKPVVTYNYADVRRDYESYLTTIGGQYL